MVAGAEAPPFTDLERSLLALSIALFSFLATFGNFLLWVSILCNKSLQRISNLFIFNLSLTDMIVGVWNMPITFVSVVANAWLLPDWACAFSAFIDNTVLFASVWTVAFCSFDRYYMLCRPHSYRSSMTKRKALIMIGVIWFVSCCFTIIPLFQVKFAYYKYSPFAFSCGLNCDDKGWGFVYCTVYTIFFVPLPLGFIVFFYFHIFRVSQRHGKKATNISNNKKDCKKQSRQQNNLRAALMILIIIGMMMSCLLPISILGMFSFITGSTAISFKIFVAFHWLLLFNNAVNPIIYGLVNPVFRKAYKNTLERFLLHVGCTTKTPVQKTLHSRTVDANSKSTSSLDEVMTVQPGDRKKKKKKRGGPNTQLSVVSLISTHTATSGGSTSNLRSSSHVR
ncbi:trace amine-associated receptor 5-like [Bolinopsis microptera]|uniref:trace amine-associated receptor 5-like n=1 Tax=Bolinopsis microptera TaxID=2820187 RepID=UPI0030799590